MDVEFDPAKDADNVEKHGVSLARTAGLDIREVVENSRPDDKERRFRLYGLIDGVPGGIGASDQPPQSQSEGKEAL